MHPAASRNDQAAADLPETALTSARRVSAIFSATFFCEVPREMGIEGGGLGRTVVGEPTDHRQSVAQGKSTRSEGNAVRCGRDEMGSGGCSASVRL